jgi:NADH-quinone oxidoreductase subunit E
MTAELRKEETAEEFHKLIQGYPPEKRYIIPIMHELRRCYQYLPRPALEMLADHMQVPFSQVYGVATFYKAFSLVPKGRVNLKLCDGTTCHIKGSQGLIDEIYRTLGIRPGETTGDRQFSLETVNCIGACALAPALIVDEKVYAQVSNARLQEIIEQNRRGEDGTESN